MASFPRSQASSPPSASASEAERRESPAEHQQSNASALQVPDSYSLDMSIGTGGEHQRPRAKRESPARGKLDLALMFPFHDETDRDWDDLDDLQSASENETLYEEPLDDAAARHRDEVIDKIMESFRVVLDRKVSRMREHDETPTQAMGALKLHAPRFMGRASQTAKKKRVGLVASLSRLAGTAFRGRRTQSARRQDRSQVSSPPPPPQLFRPAPITNLESVRCRTPSSYAEEESYAEELSYMSPDAPLASPAALGTSELESREALGAGAAAAMPSLSLDSFPTSEEESASLNFDFDTGPGTRSLGGLENAPMEPGRGQFQSHHETAEESKEEEGKDDDNDDGMGFALFDDDVIPEDRAVDFIGGSSGVRADIQPEASHVSQRRDFGPQFSQALAPQVTLSTGEPPTPLLTRRRSEGAEEGDHDGRRKKSKRTTSDTKPGVQGKKFACPYFKRNPKKYSKWTSCPGPGWEEVHRVKTHLYRRHALPVQCPRCWVSFKTDTLFRAHLQQDPPCTVAKNGTLLEGFTKDQEKKLRSRKKTHADMTDDDKWKEIYLVLFPDDDPLSMPSPYYESQDADEVPPLDEFENYAKFVRREMPTLVRRELETLFTEEFQDIEERLRPRVAQIVLNLQPRLLQLYRQSSTDSQTSQASDASHQPASSTEASSTPATTSSNPTSESKTDTSSPNFDWVDWQTPSTTGPASSAAGTDGSFDWDAEFDSLLNQSLFADVPVLLNSTTTQAKCTGST